MRRLLQRLAAWFDGVDNSEKEYEQPSTIAIECDACGLTYVMPETEGGADPQSCPGCGMSYSMVAIECDDCGMTYLMPETEWWTNPQSCPGCCRGLPRNDLDGGL